LQVPKESELRRTVPIMNPLTDETPLLRTTLLGSVLENAARNFSRKNEDIRLFEVAPVFFPKSLPITELPDEVQKLLKIQKVYIHTFCEESYVWKNLSLFEVYKNQKI